MAVTTRELSQTNYTANLIPIRPCLPKSILRSTRLCKGTVCRMFRRQHCIRRQLICRKWGIKTWNIVKDKLTFLKMIGLIKTFLKRTLLTNQEIIRSNWGSKITVMRIILLLKIWCANNIWSTKKVISYLCRLGKIRLRKALFLSRLINYQRLCNRWVIQLSNPVFKILQKGKTNKS